MQTWRWAWLDNGIGTNIKSSCFTVWRRSVGCRLGGGHGWTTGSAPTSNLHGYVTLWHCGAASETQSLPHITPAEKNAQLNFQIGTRGSPNTAPATKMELGVYQILRPPRKVGPEVHQILRLPRKMEQGVYQILCTTKLAGMYLPVLLCTTEFAGTYFPVLPCNTSTTLYYKACRNVLAGTTLYYKACRNVLPSTTLYYKACRNLLPSTTLYYKACRNVLPSTTLYYKACGNVLPSTTLYYKTCRNVLSSTTLYCKACRNALPYSVLQILQEMGTQVHQILRLPRKMTIWSILESAWDGQFQCDLRFARKACAAKIEALPARKPKS